MQRARAATWVMALAVMLLLLAACSKTLEMDDVESEIQDGITEQTGIPVSDVDCPDEVEAEEGGTFECTATGEDGSEATVEVTQTSDDGDIRWEVQ